MNLSLCTVALWSLSIGGHLWLVALAIRHRIEKRDPVFAAYVYLVAIESPAFMMVAIFGRPMSYFWCYYIGMFADHLLVLGVIASIYFSVFGPARSLPRWVPRRAMVLTALSLLLGLAIAISTKYAADLHNGPLTRMMLTIEQSLAAPACFLLWGLVIFAAVLGYEWRRQLAGIAAGFMLTQTVNVLGVFLRLTHSAPVAMVSSYVQISVYFLSLLWWVKVLWRKEALPVDATPEERKLAFARFSNAIRMLGV